MLLSIRFPCIFVLQTGGFHAASTVRIVGVQSPLFSTGQKMAFINTFLFFIYFVSGKQYSCINHNDNTYNKQKNEILYSVKKRDIIKVMKEVLTVAKQAKRQFISKPNIFSAKMDPCYLQPSWPQAHANLSSFSFKSSSQNSNCKMNLQE